MSHDQFAALVASWHDFYLTAGAAAAALIGLLFVGISINLDAFTTDQGTGIRLLAEQAFANFVFVLVIALMILIPDQDQASVAVALGVVGVLGTFRIMRRSIALRRGSAQPVGGWRHVVRRLGLSAVASVGIIAVAALVLVNPVSALYWLVAVILIFLTSAADAAWDLLIEVGRERRRGTS